MNMAEIDCARAEEKDSLARYLGGRLSEADAKAFEAHYFGCERCWAEVNAAAEIREAKGFDVFSTPPTVTRGARRDVWTLLAAAAAVAVMVLGLRQLSEISEVSRPGTVLRGSHLEPLSLTIRPGSSGEFVLQWSARPEAQVYVVEIFGPDGATVWEKETSETTATVEAGALPTSRPGISLYATVEALDGTRQPVARSQRIRLPRP